MSARNSAVLATSLADGAQRLFWTAGGGESKSIGDDLPVAVCVRARDILAKEESDEAITEELGGKRFLFAPFLPPRRLLIAGAAHIAESLSVFGRALAFEVFIVDPREAWARPERFAASAAVMRRWPDEAFAEIGIDRQSAVVALSHDPKIDDPALLAALAAKPRYIGALGSKRTHRQRLVRLRAAGVAEESLSRIHAPLGLSLGAKNAAEIALSAAAQIIAAYRGGDAR
jgi:xanthine dehydrogenase accessory factor